MWNISKTADRRAKRTKKCDSGYYGTHMEVTVDALFLEFGLGSFSALYKISNFTIFKTLVLSKFSSDSSELFTKYPNHGAIQAITFLVICQKLRKKSWHFEIFLNI